MAQALIKSGNEVTFWTNNDPFFRRDFDNSIDQELISLDLSLNWKPFKKGNYDWIILIPDMVPNHPLYEKALLSARLSKSKITLLSFETPNWFNSLSSKKRSAELWSGWKRVAKYASLILSSTREGDHFAKAFYEVSQSVQFEYCYPAINSTISVEKSHSKRNQILLITRFDKNSDHKGSDKLLQLFDSRLKGYDIAIISGMNMDSDVTRRLDELSKDSGVGLNVYQKVTDDEKFGILSESKLLLFLTEFEGFGYPPIEALSSGTNCLISPIPVLKETCDGYVDFFDKEKDLVNQVLESLNKQPVSLNRQMELRDKFSIESFAERLKKLFNKDFSENRINENTIVLTYKIFIYTLKHTLKKILK